jgi:hypothetical protein
MKNKLITIMCLHFTNAGAQSESGVEQYYYTHTGGSAVYVPVAYYNTSGNWYGEARYNYDDVETFSLYAGKKFSREGDLSYSATPMIGGLVGRMNGASVGMNMEAGFQKLFFTCQSQYSFSLEDKTNKFFFNWSELGVQATDWLYGGLAMQQTNIYKTTGSFEPGCMLGVSWKNWTLPFYAFNPGNEEGYFVLGIYLEWENVKKTGNKNILITGL